MFSNKKIVVEVRVVFQTSHCSDIFWVCICLREVVEDYFHITFFSFHSLSLINLSLSKSTSFCTFSHPILSSIPLTGGQ